MKRIIRGLFCALFAFCLIGSEAVYGTPGTVCAGDFTETLYAGAAVLMDADSGRVLFGKNADVPMAMASTTKIMTCILLLEEGDQEEMLQVSSYAAGMPKVKLSVRKGESYRMEDLLYSLMLESHNDSAVVLAEYIGSRYLPEEFRKKEIKDHTVEESRQAVLAFASMMNQKAEEIGCSDTYFITPNGLDATEDVTNQETVQKEHHTTAQDLAKIMSYCIKKSEKREEFLHITKTASYSFSANGRSFVCSNHNAFLTMMEGALSGKTGFTNKAGYCYAGALERDGRTFVVALLACGWPNHKTYKWSDTSKLMQYGIDHYFYRDFSSENVAFNAKSLKPIPVEHGQTSLLGEKASVSVAISGGQIAEEGLLMRPEEEVRVECHVERVLQAPVERGTPVGKIYYVVDDTIYREEIIVTQQDIKKIDLKWCVQQIFDRFTDL